MGVAGLLPRLSCVPLLPPPMPLSPRSNGGLASCLRLASVKLAAAPAGLPAAAATCLPELPLAALLPTCCSEPADETAASAAPAAAVPPPCASSSCWRRSSTMQRRHSITRSTDGRAAASDAQQRSMSSR